MDQSNLTIFCKNCGIFLLSHISVPSSRTPHLHRTYQAPNASESKILRDVLLQAGSDLAQLDSEIDQVRAVQVEALREKREALLKFTAEHSAIFSPICRLPLELLTDILAHCSLSSTLLQELYSVHKYVLVGDKSLFRHSGFGRQSVSHIMAP